MKKPCPIIPVDLVSLNDTSLEQVIVVDQKNRVTGAVSRSEMRRRRLIHRASYVLVTNAAGEIFVQKRTRTKDIYPGLYDVAAGGVVQAGESFEQSAVRELAEELGVRDAALRFHFDHYWEDAGNRVWGRVFSIVHEGPFVLQASEVESGMFLSASEILAGARKGTFTPDGIAILHRLQRMEGGFVASAGEKGFLGDSPLLARFRASLSAKLLVVTALVLFAGIGSLFVAAGMKDERLHLRQVEAQARMLFRQIILTRRWIADHGGVFVAKIPGVEPNPYLANNTIVDQRGALYLRENPALVTRHLSAYAKKTGYYWFNITSLAPVNPANTPDPFERAALEDFSAGRKSEAMKVLRQENLDVFRYIAPLFTEKACLECHPTYRVGDVRGGLSVTIPIDSLLREISRNRTMLLAGALSGSAVLFAVLFLFLRHFVLSPLSRIGKAMEHYPRERATDHVHSADELGVLARTFDHMSDKIRDYQDTLEKRVEDATRQLVDTNSRLEKTGRLYQELSLRKSDFIGRISHELRTPLTAVRGAVDYLQSCLVDPLKECACGAETLRQFLAILAANSDHMTRLVNETLDLEKIETGRADFRYSVFDTAAALAEVLHELFPLFHSRQLAMHVDFEPGLFVCGDRDRIKDVVTNLLVNAFDYSPAGARLAVESRRLQDRAQIRVQDEGPGVAVEVQEKIFEKFYKLRTGGTGLGLALCRSIVVAHSGRIWVESDGLRGSTFIVELPLHDGLI